MKKIFQKFKNHKYRNLIYVLGLVLVFVVLILPNKVLAYTGEDQINWVFYWIGNFFGLFVTFLIGFLMRVAAYNDFTTSTAVQTGWKLMRDVCNMFFIVIMMIIAICTIIRVEAYNYKKMLPTLLVKAVLINFSLMFCGLLIDVSQVITLTFVDAFKGAGEGNFITGMGMDKVYQVARAGGPMTGTTTSLMLGAVMLAISTAVIGALVVVFLGRIIAFWILIVLSPFTFLASASGFGAKYADQWWSEFTKYLIVGPVLAFFLWLSLFVMRESVLQAVTSNMKIQAMPSIGFSEAGTPNTLAFFAISIAMLLGSLVAAQQIGTVGSGAAGATLSGLKKTGMWGVNWGGRRLDDTFVGKFSAKMAGGAFGLSGYAFDSDKYKNKWAKGAAKIANVFLTGGLGKGASKAGMKVWKQGGMQWRVVPKMWDEAEARREMIETTPGRGTARGAFDMFKTGDETGQEYRAQNLLIQEELKNLEERGLLGDTEALTHQFIHGRTRQSRMAAAHVINKYNDFDAVIRSKEFMSTCSEDDFKRMGVKRIYDEEKQKWGWGGVDKDGDFGVDRSSDYVRSYLLQKFIGKDKIVGKSDKFTGSDKIASQFIATEIGETGLASGNFQNWNLGEFNPETGEHELRDFWDKNGNPDPEKIKKHAIAVGKKVNTMDFREATRKAHVDSFKRRLFTYFPGDEKNEPEICDDRVSLEPHMVGEEVAGNILVKTSAVEFERATKASFVDSFWKYTEEQDLINPKKTNKDGLNEAREYYIDKQGWPESIVNVAMSKVAKKINAARVRAGLDQLGPLNGMNSDGSPITSDVKSASKRAPAGGASTTPPRGGRPIMADVNREKYNMTQEKIKEFQDKGGLDFYISDDYERNKEQYYDQGTIERIDRSKSSLEKDRAKRTLTDPKTNMNRVDVMSGISSAKIKGQKGESVALGINAQNDQLQGLIREGAAGVCLIGEDKEKAIEQIGSFYADQLRAQNEQLGDAEKLSDEQMQAEVDSLKNSLSQASSLRLINKNREGFDAKSVLRHELMHDRINNADQGKLKEVWDSMDKDKKATVSSRIKSEWVGGENFKDEQVRNEYFAEGAANFGRKDTAGGIQLEAGQARALQQAGIKMKGVPEEEEDIKVEKMSKGELKTRIGDLNRKEKKEAWDAYDAETQNKRQAKKKGEIKHELNEEQELKNAKADARQKTDIYHQKVSERENKQQEFNEKSVALNQRKKNAQQLLQQAEEAGKHFKTKESNNLLKQYNSEVESIKKEEDKIDGEVNAAEVEVVFAQNQAQESSRNYTEKENVVKAKGVDGQIKELQAKKDSVADVYEIQTPTPKVKAPKVDFDKQISKLEERKESARKFEAHDTERQLDQEIKELKEKKASASAEPAGGGFQKVDVNKEIRDLSNTIRGLKEGLKNPAKNDGEKDSIRKDLGASNIKLNGLKDQKNRAIEQQIQEFNQKKVELSQSQRNIERSSGVASTFKGEDVPASAKAPFSAEEFVKQTSAAKETPPVYQVDETHNQEIVNNVTNVINAAEGDKGFKELQNAITNSLASPMGRYWIIKAIQKGMSDMPNNIKGLLSPDFANLVSDDEKAVQDKELAKKMENYIGDVKMALGELGKKE